MHLQERVDNHSENELSLHDNTTLVRVVVLGISMRVSGTMPSKYIEEFGSKPEMFTVTSRASMMVNSATTKRGLEPPDLPTFWYRFMDSKRFRICSILKIMDMDLVSACLWTLGEVVLFSDMFMKPDYAGDSWHRHTPVPFSMLKSMGRSRASQC